MAAAAASVGGRKRLLAAALLSVVALDLHVAFVRSSAFGSVFFRAGEWACWALPSKVDLGGEMYDYEQLSTAWAAHPHLDDAADLVPPESSEMADAQSSATADVFLIYPTGYFGLKWNAPAGSAWWWEPLGWLNDVIADAVVGIHGSAFNGVARVYAPRYRQMTGFGFMAYDERTRALRDSALAFALADIERAFNHFLRVRGAEDRPIVLVGHSQGSMLLVELIKERFAGSNNKLRKQLVAAYLTGTLLFEDDLGEIKVCRKPLDLHCFIGYNAFEVGGNHLEFVLRRQPPKDDERVMVCVNPLSWHADEVHVPKEHNPGSRPVLRVARMLNAVREVISGKPLNPSSPLEPGLFGGICKEGVLWTEPVEHSGFWTTGVFPGRNLHGEESSLFYLSTRRNVEARVAEWHRQRQAWW